LRIVQNLNAFRYSVGRQVAVLGDFLGRTDLCVSRPGLRRPDRSRRKSPIHPTAAFRAGQGRQGLRALFLSEGSPVMIVGPRRMNRASGIAPSKRFNDPKVFPWSIPFYPDFEMEGAV